MLWVGNCGVHREKQQRVPSKGRRCRQHKRWLLTVGVAKPERQVVYYRFTISIFRASSFSLRSLARGMFVEVQPRDTSRLSNAILVDQEQTNTRQACNNGARFSFFPHEECSRGKSARRDGRRGKDRNAFHRPRWSTRKRIENVTVAYSVKIKMLFVDGGSGERTFFQHNGGGKFSGFCRIGQGHQPSALTCFLRISTPGQTESFVDFPAAYRVTYRPHTPCRRDS